MATTSQRLAEGARYSKETLTTTSPLPVYVTEFQSVFAKKDFDILSEYRKWDHAIKLISRAEPKSSKVYPLSLLEQAKLNAFLEENLHTRRIWPSKSSIAAPVFFIKKKDGSLWLVQDYRVITNGHLLFMMGALILQRAQKCEVRQVTKDVVKSEV